MYNFNLLRFDDNNNIFSIISSILILGTPFAIQPNIFDKYFHCISAGCKKGNVPNHNMIRDK